jgi:hypothetical protein
MTTMNKDRIVLLLRISTLAAMSGSPMNSLGILYANMLTNLFTWLLLVGFIILPVIFSSIRNSRALDNIGKAGKALFGAIQNAPFLWVAGTCFVFGVTGLSWLWWKNRSNYIFLTDRVFL